MSLSGVLAFYLAVKAHQLPNKGPEQSLHAYSVLRPQKVIL